MESQGSPHFYLAESNGCTQTKVGEPHSGRICRTDWPSGDKTMGGHGQNNQPRRKSLELSLLPSRPKMRGSLRCRIGVKLVGHAARSLLLCHGRCFYVTAVATVGAAVGTVGAAVASVSWPGLAWPSTTLPPSAPPVVDGRHK